ncbi:hypothetical protein Tco_0550117, partial [Tanacetum coccineum]
MVVKSKRPGRVKASSDVSNGDLALGLSDEERDDTSDLQVVRDENKGSLLEEGVIDNGVVVESQTEQAESEEKKNHTLHQEVTFVPG